MQNILLEVVLAVGTNLSSRILGLDAEVNDTK